MLDKLVEITREHRQTVIPPLERINSSCQVSQQSRSFDFKMPENPSQVGVRRLGQLGQPVLELDAVIGT